MKKINSALFFVILCAFFGHIAKAQAQKTFVHPGIPFTQEDLAQLKVNINQEPWLSGYNALKNDARSKLSYSMQGPFATVSRAPNLNNTQWKSDMMAVHNLTFMYIFTGDNAYAQKATNILDAWAVTNTAWEGNENMLDIGDYVPYFVTAADILKSTYPGWTPANTEHVRTYFANIIYPTSWVPNPLRDCNKGAIQLQIGLSVAAFLDDETKWNQSIELYRMDAGAALRNSTPSGQVGDTGRDDHWFGQAWALMWGAEVAHKQGVDMFAEMDNRLLAIGELYNHYAIDPTGLTYIPYGGYSVYWSGGWGIKTGSRKQHPFNNIIQGAYSLRKGIPTPYTDQMRTLVGENGWSFLYLKSSDASTSVPMTPIIYPSENAVPVSYLTNTDIGITGIKGTAEYTAGIWTVKGAGTAPSNSTNYTFKPVKGDAAIIVKVENNSINQALSGLMIRESLSAASKYASINFTPSGVINLNSSGATASNSGYTHYATNSAWWLKMERVGNRVFAYHSADGVTWTNIGLFIMPLASDAYIGFYTSSRNTSALNTAKFSNVSVNSNFASGAPQINSSTAATATTGSGFTFTITATGNPVSFGAAGLPEGLSINASTGVISGTPVLPGKNVVLLEATNSSGTAKAALVIETTANQAPSAISNLTVTSANSIVKLTWPAATNATSYTVKRSSSSGGPYTAIQTDITGSSFIDPSPLYEVNNYYTVTALSGGLESAASNEVFASVPPEVPSQPVVANGSGQIHLSWTSATGAQTYAIKRSTTMGGPYTVIGSTSATNYTDANLINGIGYYYVLSSVGTTKESENSVESFGVAGAVTRTWNTNPISEDWNQNLNWTEASVPSSPAILSFNTSTETLLNNDLTGLEISRIIFNADAYAYTIEGNSLTLKSDLVNNSQNSQTLSTALSLNGQLNVNTNGQDIKLKGEITGSGGLLKSGARFLYLSAANTYSGNTVITGTTGGWPPQNALAIAGAGTGTQGAPLSGPLGTGKIILSGGSLLSEAGDATLYNDIEVAEGIRSYMYETSYAMNLRGRLVGKGTLEHDGNTYAGLHLYGDNSQFEGTFISKLRSGNQRVRFEVPQSGSAKAFWLLDANGVDCHSIQFATGTLHFGGLSGRGYLRNNAGGSPVISIGALNGDSNFGGTFANFLNVEKIGTGKLIYTGNHTYGGTTTIKKGKFLLNNNPTTGTFASPITVEDGVFGGTGLSQSSVTIGTGAGAGAKLEPGNEAAGTITVGAVTLKSDGSYLADINLNNATGDKIAANSVNLINNPSLIVNALAGTPALGTSYIIIENRGTAAVNGIFKNLPELSILNVGGFDFRITYKGGTGNDVQLLDDRTVPVVITSAETASGLVGKSFSYSITGIKSPEHFNAAGLPSGLSIDASTGVISGTPTEYGVFPVTITAANSSTTGTANLKITIQSDIVSGVIAAAGDNQNIIEWDPIQDFTYNIKRASVSDGPFTTIGSSATAKFADTGVINGNIYYYAVCAVENSLEKPQSTAVQALPDKGQMTYLKFNEQNGTRLIDSWGAAHGSFAPAALRDTGKYEKGAKFDGTATSYATLPAGIVSTLSDYTITAWVKMDALANWMRIFDFGSDTNKYMFFSVQTGSAGSIRYAIKNGGAEQGITYNFTTPLNSWTHFAVTQSGNTVSIYINGNLAASNSSISIKPTNLGNTTLNYLAKSQWNDPMFKGTIDEFKIYKRALNTAEILQASKLVQTILINPVAEKQAGEVDFDPAAASSGLPVEYASSNTAVASIVNGKIQILTAGTATITASQSGNESYNAAKSTTQLLTVSKAAQSILFNALNEKETGSPDFDPMAKASSNLPVYYYSSNESVAKIINGKVHILGAGAAGITAAQPGNDSYSAAAEVTQNLIVNKLFYIDADQDGFGSASSVLLPLNIPPAGYSENNSDCDDSQILYADDDGDGLGAGLPVACGVSNSDDCDDANPVQLTASIPDVSGITNQQKNTIFVGYGPASLSVKAVASGGTAPYSFVWSTNQTSQTIAINAAGSYTVLITDAKGCQSTASIEINTVNVQCGLSNNKVQVCHNNLEICLSSSAVQAHLSHGDQLGGCDRNPYFKITEKVLIYPNPVETVCTIVVDEVHTGAVLELYNILGWRIKSIPLTQTSQELSLAGVLKGVYFLHVKNGKHYTIKSLIKN